MKHPLSQTAACREREQRAAADLLTDLNAWITERPCTRPAWFWRHLGSDRKAGETELAALRRLNLLRPSELEILRKIDDDG